MPGRGRGGDTELFADVIRAHPVENEVAVDLRGKIGRWVLEIFQYVEPDRAGKRLDDLEAFRSRLRKFASSHKCEIYRTTMRLAMPPAGVRDLPR